MFTNKHGNINYFSLNTYVDYKKVRKILAGLEPLERARSVVQNEVHYKFYKYDNYIYLLHLLR